ncbi:MAG: glycosyltransferase [Deltaproteobacteria bacterium]|nr:glycosyltransferase [Deltaproteobacteria bacterium]
MAEVVIPVYGNAPGLARLLGHLRGHDVILVDDASPDAATRELVRGCSRRHGVRAVVHERNLGFPAAANRGASLVQSDRFFLLNSDVVPFGGWDTAMSRALDERARAAAVGALLLFPDGITVAHAGIEIGSEGIPVHRYRYFTRHAPEVLEPRELDMITYAAILLRTAPFRELGGLDEGFGFGMYDDCDMGLRFVEAGWSSVYEPSAVFIHEESASFGLRPDDLEIRIKGKERFLEKWVRSGRLARLGGGRWAVGGGR